MIPCAMRVVIGLLVICAGLGACGAGQAARAPQSAPARQADDPAHADSTPATEAPAARPKDRWEGIPPLAPEGRVIHEAHYDIHHAGEFIGEERLAVSMVDGKRVVVGQSVTDWGGHFEISYRVAPDSVTFSLNGPPGSHQLAGQLVDGIFRVTGTDTAGNPVSLSARLPENGFLSAPGIGAMLMLLDHVRELKVGETKQLSSLQIAGTATVKIGSASYGVERKPDIDGRQVFEVAIEAGRFRQKTELVLDGDGFIVKQTDGAPSNLTDTRRP
jgi:hypothetical protein